MEKSQSLPSTALPRPPVTCLAVGALIGAALHHPAPFVASALSQGTSRSPSSGSAMGESRAPRRLGKYVGLRGRGAFLIVPVIDTLSESVDQRVRVASVTAESTLTRDTVPVNVGAIVFGGVERRKSHPRSGRFLPTRSP